MSREQIRQKSVKSIQIFDEIRKLGSCKMLIKAEEKELKYLENLKKKKEKYQMECKQKKST